MTRYRYGLTLRPLSQINLMRLEYCIGSWQIEGWPDYRTHGTASFHRRWTPFEENQLDLVFIREEECPDCG